MKHILLPLSFLFLLVISSCNPRTVTDARTKSGSARVAKIYKTYEEFAPRIHPKTNDKTIYIVNFFATWCTQCRKEIPHLVALDKKYKNNSGVKVLFVNLDEKSRQSYVPSFMKKYGIQSEVVSLIDPDQEKWITAINKSWNGSLPGTLFIKGKHREFYSYPLTYPELERNIGFMKAKR